MTLYKSEKMTNTNKQETIGTDSVTISLQPTNENRTLISIENVSTAGQVISIAFGDSAVSGSGRVLYPGGFHSESTDSGFECSQEKITAISSAIGGLLAIHERRE